MPIAPDGRLQPVMPGPPMQPGTTSRPASWPGGEASPWVPPDQRATPADMVPRSEVKPCDGTRILARVGSEAILESEVAGFVNELIEKYKDRIPPDQLDKQRALLVQKRLKDLIEAKLIYLDAKRTVPTEVWPKIEAELAKQFEDVQLEKMMKGAGVRTRREFDQRLRALGTSLEGEKRTFMELSLAQEWRANQIKRDEEITLDQMVSYYHQHLKEFTTCARAQWEELMVRYAKYPTKAAAYEAIARMGNQVFAGAPFADVAKAGSDGFEANKGGQMAWTNQGALACQAIDMALFNLPVGQLSPIIESDRGFHIIRVTKREGDLVKPFLEAQVEIKKKIVDERSAKQAEDYMAKLLARTPVSTDSDINNPQLATPAGPGQPLRR